MFNAWQPLFYFTKASAIMSDALEAYLHDHLAGAGTAIDLLETISKERAGDPLGQFAGELLVEVKTDRDTLRGLADQVGHGTNGLKEAAAWFAEKVSRLKLNHGSENGLGTLEALEFLALGIQGKLAMWCALSAAQALDPRLQGVDFDYLAERAKSQHEQVEQCRVDVARTVFCGRSKNIKQPREAEAPESAKWEQT